jgi:hypothetical protein
VAASVSRIVSDTAGQKTADGDQHYSERFHDASFAEKKVYRPQHVTAAPITNSYIGNTRLQSDCAAHNTLNLLTWLAARTQTLRVGTAVMVLPWHNPVLLAEQAATLDRSDTETKLRSTARSTKS